jgi:hypothetical protein
MDAIIRRTAGGVEVSNLNRTLNQAILEQLTDLSKQANEAGVDNGEVLCALAKGRKELSPFGMFCKTTGTLMSTLGTTVTLILFVVALLTFIKALVDVGAEIGRWLSDLLKRYGFYFGLAGLGASAVSFFGQADDEKDVASEALRVGGNALRGFIIHLLPAPLAAVTEVAVEEVERMLRGGGGEIKAPSTGSYNPLTSSELRNPFVGPTRTVENVGQVLNMNPLEIAWRKLTGQFDGELDGATKSEIAQRLGINAEDTIPTF